MSLRTDPLDELAIPDGTTVEEHDVVTSGDVFVGGQSVVEFGLRGNNVVAGERVRFGGDIEAEGDCRLDMWCDVDGNVLVGEDAYLGERVHVGGQLVVAGDLDIGDDVDIEQGFEANGWIVIRNPMPTIVFLFVYLSQLLRIGDEESAEEVVSEVFDDGDTEHNPIVVPRGARVNDDAWRVSTPARIGNDCRLHGNVRATTIEVGRDTEIFGSLRARGSVSVEPESVVHGDVTTRQGTVRLDATAHVRGDISCNDLLLHDEAEVDGAIRARGEVSIVGDDSGKPIPAGQAATDESTAADADADADATTADADADADATTADADADATTADADATTADADATTANGDGETDPTSVIVHIEDTAGDGSTGNGDGGLITEAEQ